LPQDFDEITNANLPPIHQVQQPQACPIRKGRKQDGDSVSFLGLIHALIIYALTDMSRKEYICFDVYKETREWIPRLAFRSK
jgi:hypothetical protein